MISSISDLLGRLPGPVNEQWPGGQRFIEALAHGSMKVELYAPLGSDPQLPHEQDELYFVVQGGADLVFDNRVTAVGAGDVMFIPAGAAHHFQNISPQFMAWVVFWGPSGGEIGAVSRPANHHDKTTNIGI